MHKIDPAVLKEIVKMKRLLRVYDRMRNEAQANNDLSKKRDVLFLIDGVVDDLKALTNCEQYILDEVLPVKVKHQYAQAAEVCLSYDGQLGFNFRQGGYIGEVYKTNDGTEYFVLAIV